MGKISDECTRVFNAIFKSKPNYHYSPLLFVTRSGMPLMACQSADLFGFLCTFTHPLY